MTQARAACLEMEKTTKTNLRFYCSNAAGRYPSRSFFDTALGDYITLLPKMILQPAVRRQG